jgi:hypothetical protein
MPHLSRLGTRVRQWVQRWLPVDGTSACQPDHAFHWVMDRYGGGPQPCCPRHGDELFHGHAPATERLIDQLSDQCQRYLAARLGGHPRDFPGPRR